MSNFYTNVQSISGKILYRGIIDNKRVKERIDYSPSLFIPSKKITKYTTLNGEYLDEKKFDKIIEAKNYIKKFEDVSGAIKIYGQTRFEYAYIADQHKGMVDYDYDKVLTAIIDIEVGGGKYANMPNKKIKIRKKDGH